MKKLTLLPLLLLALATPGFGTVIFVLGNSPQNAEENILFSTNQQAMTVTGITDQSNTVVDFTSTTDTLIVNANGQANMTALDGLINDVTITVPGGTYLDLILNPSGEVSTSVAHISVVTNDGVFPYDLTLSGAESQNFLTLYTTNNEFILSTNISSAAGFDELRQVRISGVSAAAPAPVPEPASLFLLGTGLAIIGLAAWRRKK